jgi:hypothetical protein
VVNVESIVVNGESIVNMVNIMLNVVISVTTI